MQKELTEISKIGEFGLINKISDAVKLYNPESEKGIGDDAAILNFNGSKILVATDMLTEGVHFDLSYMPLQHLGYKAVAINLSDIYAMNGEPKQITVSIGLSSRFSVEHVEEIYKGINKACELYKVDIVGGDTVASLSGLIISITAIGVVNSKEITMRSGAQENDLICVSGDLGAAYLGLKLLTREKAALEVAPHQQPQFGGYEYLIERQLKPEPRRDIYNKLKEASIIPTSMIDISDGLSSELMHICKSSGKGCRIYDEKIPIHEQSIRLCDEFNIDPTIPALNGGEDYELLFTIKQSDYERIEKIENVSVIGHITSYKDLCEIVFRDGTAVPLTAHGWNAFES
ncbi:MAG TPA: thiamine-phosphate kinase [Salinivirgaceae bacterium]|nr:thiamine-phosphate kinase [Salinivirgaceae bacterium]